MRVDLNKFNVFLFSSDGAIVYCGYMYTTRDKSVCTNDQISDLYMPRLRSRRYEAAKRRTQDHAPEFTDGK
jgi:hypothetical protein